MKVNELMIGDLVFAKVTSKRKVPVNVKNIYGNLFNATIWYGYEIQGGYSIKDAKPIPLTPEILEKNKCSYDGDFWCFTHPKHFGMTYLLAYYDEYDESVAEEFRGHWAFDENFIIDNVHELQHALRLCKLDKLANNFKVE